MIKTSEKICRKCIYSRRFSSGRMFCNYLAIKKESRGCNYGECDKYVEKKRRRKK